ncbi:MAG: rhodanese-like domain-containing protein [Bacillaceae bacterium]
MKKIIIAIIMTFLLVGCASESTSYQTISLKEGYDFIQQEKVMVLDVRTREEFQSGHIPGAINIPVEILEDHVNKLDKKQAYFVICRSGNRSKTASQLLVDNDFKSIYNAQKGMSAWIYEVEQ